MSNGIFEFLNTKGRQKAIQDNKLDLETELTQGGDLVWKLRF